MDWTKVTFDLDSDQPPGIEPQWIVADRAIVAYESLGKPAGFAVYDLKDLESMLYSFFYSPIAAQHFLEFIKSNRSEVWDKPLPEGVHLIVGDSTVLPDAD
jgi:hypothetical protein